MVSPVGIKSPSSTSPSSTTSTTSSTPTDTSGTAATSKSSKTSGVDSYITRSSGEEIPQRGTCSTSITRSSGEEIPQRCGVGGISAFSLSLADFSAL